MNNKVMKSFLYQLHESKKAVIIYYFIVLAVYVTIFITTSVSMNHNEVDNYSYGIGGIGFSTAIFLFCACAFRETFHMLMQNGMSRKSVYLGRIMNSVVLSFILALIDLLIKYIFGFFASMIDELFFFQSLFESFYNGYCFEKNAVIVFMVAFLFFFVLFMFFHTLGYLMSTVFYRLGKTAKVVFAAGIPVSIFVILPSVDNLFFNGQIITEILKLTDNLLGLSVQNPFIGVLSFTLGMILFIALSWLPIRRARVE